MKLSDEAAALIAAQYVLGGQTPRMRQVVEKRAGRDPRLALALRQWGEHGADLAASTAAPEVPERVWLHIKAQLPRAPAASRGIEDALPWWRRLWGWQSGVAVAAAVALTVGVLPMLHRAPSDQAVLSAPGNENQAPPAANPSNPAVAKSVAPTVAPTVAPSFAPTVAPPTSSPANVQIPAAASLPEVSAEPLALKFESKVVPKLAELTAARRLKRSVAASAPRPLEVTPAIDQRETPMPKKSGNSDSTVIAAPPQTTAAPVTEDHTGRTFTTRGVGGAAAIAGEAVSTLATKQGAVAWEVRLDEGRGELRVKLLAPQNAGEAGDFELWAIPADGGAPRAIGLIAGDKDVVLSLDKVTQRSVRMASALAVSVEPVGGSPGDGPTGPVNYTGRVEKI